MNIIYHASGSTGLGVFEAAQRLTEGVRALLLLTGARRVEALRQFTRCSKDPTPKPATIVMSGTATRIWRVPT